MLRASTRAVTRSQKFGLDQKLPETNELPPPKNCSRINEDPPQAEKATETITDSDTESDYGPIIPSNEPPLHLHGYTMHDYNYAQYSIHPPLYPPTDPFLHLRMYPRCLLSQDASGKVRAHVHLDQYEVAPVPVTLLSFGMMEESRYGLLYKHRDMTKMEDLSAQFEWGIWIHCFREWTFERVFVREGRNLVLEFV